MFYSRSKIVSRIEKEVTMPKYQDIADTVVHLIDIGHYREGSKLPTHRALAEEYATTPVTIAKAYSLLADQGHIESFVGRGSFVKKRSSLRQAIQPQLLEDEWNFSILQPCLAHHLETLNNQISQCFSNTASPSLFGYTEQTGSLLHKNAGMRWLQHFGLHVRSAEHVLLTNGAQHALSLLIELYSQPGDVIAVEALTYPGILSIINALGRKAVGVTQDEQGMCPKHLQEVCKQSHPSLVIIVPSHQNPTTVTLSIERREAIASVIQKYQTWLIEDDIYAFLNSEKIPPITNLIPEKSFYISSLSKAISPGMRCGYLKAPQSQIEHLSTLIRTMIWLVSPITFEIATQMINSEKAFELANQQKNIAEQRQVIAHTILEKDTFSAQVSSFHIWLALPDNINTDQFVATAKERGMLISNGRYFCHDESYSQYVRLSLMSIPTHQHFEKGLMRLKQLLDQNRT